MRSIGERDDRALRRRPSAPGPCRRCAPPSRDTRAGGRCSAPVSRSREPTKPNFQSSLRPAADAETPGRLGPARRLDREHAAPREELAVGERRAGRDLRRRPGAPAGTPRCASVVRNTSTSAPSASDDQRDRPGPAAARLERAASSSAGCAAPVLPTVAARSSTTRLRRDAEPLGERRATARACVPAMTTWSTLLGVEPGGLRAPSFHACSPSGHVAASRRTAPPTRFERAVARRAPAVEELLGRDAGAEVARR